MRMPGLELFNIVKHFVMGSRESDTTSMVLYDRTLLWLTFGLAIIGFVMVTSASMPIGQRLASDPFLFAKRDALYLALAFGMSLVTLRIPMAVWQRYSNIMLLISIVMLLVVLVVGSSVNGAVFRTFQGDDNVGFALGQADEVGEGQDIYRDRRVGIDEVAQLRGDEETAETFRTAHAHMARQCHAGAGHLLAGHVQGALNGLGIAQQTLAFGGEDEAVGPGLFEQQRAEGHFQRTDAPRHGGVVHRQALGGDAGLAGAGYFKEKLQVIPVQGAQRCDVFLHIGPAFMCVLIRDLHIDTPKTVRTPHTSRRFNALVL